MNTLIKNMTPEELKQQAHKEFDESFKCQITGGDWHNYEYVAPQVKSFIDSLIDRTVQISFAEGQKTYKQFILNILDGHDQANIKNGFAPNTRTIRFAIESRFIGTDEDLIKALQEAISNSKDKE